MDVLDEMNSRAGVETFIPTDDAVGEDAKILVAFAKVDEHALCGGEAGGGDDGDVGF